MKALCKVSPGRGNIEIRDLEEPRYGKRDVLVRVAVAGICGSDLHIYNWDTQVKTKPPVVMGHEFSGVIEAVGSEVSDWNPGDRVTAEPSYSVCGKCRYCMTGRYNLCHERRVLGFWADGAFAEYTVVPEYRLHELPDNVSFEEGAMTEPLACGVHGVHELLNVGLTERVVVTGPGAIGILAAQVAKAAGAQVTVVGTGADRDRLELCKELGLPQVVNLDDTDPAELMHDETDGVGADVVIECSGAQPAVKLGLEIIRKGGRYLQLGLFGHPIEVDFESIAYKELTLFGSFAQKWTSWKTTLELMSGGNVRLGPLVTDTLPLVEWQSGFNKLNRKEGLKVLLKP